MIHQENKQDSRGKIVTTSIETSQANPEAAALIYIQYVLECARSQEMALTTHLVKILTQLFAWHFNMKQHLAVSHVVFRSIFSIAD